jgi:zinc protease
LLAARQALETPRGQAGRAFWAATFPGHPAGRPAGGTPESLPAIGRDAVAAAIARQVRREGVLIAAAGDITPQRLAALLPELFGGLPSAPPPIPPPLPAPARFGVKLVPVVAPQSQAVFGQAGLPVQDPDWESAQLMLRVLGGGGFSSRLMQAVRVRRGLAYGIGVSLDALFGEAMLVGSVATENARMAETLAVLREEWSRMADSGPTEDELADAIAFLTGNLPLQFTDTRRIAGTLLSLRRNGRPLDWLERRPARLAAITRDRAAATARRLLDAQALSMVVAGQPVGL